VLKAFATTVTTSSPLAIVASVFMLVEWMLPERRRLICWKQALIPEFSWADYSFSSSRTSCLSKGGVMSRMAGNTSDLKLPILEFVVFLYFQVMVIV
jgi:hypothetical protein